VTARPAYWPGYLGRPARSWPARSASSSSIATRAGPAAAGPRASRTAGNGVTPR